MRNEVENSYFIYKYFSCIKCVYRTSLMFKACMESCMCDSTPPILKTDFISSLLYFSRDSFWHFLWKISTPNCIQSYFLFLHVFEEFPFASNFLFWIKRTPGVVVVLTFHFYLKNFEQLFYNSIILSKVGAFFANAFLYN